MEARRKARSMKRSASMGRAASRSAARGKAKARAMGRAKRGGEDDIEMGREEQKRQDAEEMKRNDLSFAEEGRSRSPPIMQGDPDSRVDLMEKGRAFKKGDDYYDPKAYLNVGGKRRRSKKFYKGKASKTRKGRKDFVTHKGDKYFHRKGHRQTKRQGKSKGLFEQLFGL
jgi:hypothetical protein